MKYKDSNLDRNLRRWFTNDNTCALLRQIRLSEGLMRGLTPFSLDFSYPITAIAGKNGSGKSTILALACCAFHNSKTGFALANRKQSYYTFADFFIQHSEDVPPEGISIDYKIAHDNWKKTTHCPDGVGALYQTRKKKKGGKWNDYASRVRRNVVFMGIDRIVPHTEKSQSKSYSRTFKHAGEQGWENDVKNCVGKILGKKYDSFKYVSHSKYRLPIVTSNGRKYSGFHMGAGENALFELFAIMYSVPKGSLIVVDEIELGLHSDAQTKLVSALKELCKTRKLQIICTTHSKEVFEELPEDARVFIDNVNASSVIVNNISPEFAFSKLSSKNTVELCILVEDEVAKALLLTLLPSHIRSRVVIEVIGSSSALSRQLASNYMREQKDNILVVFDGDQKSLETTNLKHALKMSEAHSDADFYDWVKPLIDYLPGNTWPEAWIIQKSLEKVGPLSLLLGASEDETIEACERGLEASKHDEFFAIGRHVGLEAPDTLQRFCIHISQHHDDEFSSLIGSIQAKLDKG
ncbi:MULTISPECIES: ATP-dependent nuclease [Vibrio harveyi group]|nr:MULTISPECIES: ATP-binding protein [Vibrio harveyi group]ELB2788440.1 AAA family ATPase [Vibrio alginolyticus]MCG9618972.1 ATP-binding protein [Vibrio diabolicus]EGQ7819257.1 ATP-binding protein [Vibrio parahaemolyticus]EGQ8705382.1 AAA family ATPase [Vibrio parahaemolyticus]EGQ9123328.1 AAA family ATPase [Vibrio parahaemolyticus]